MKCIKLSRIGVWQVKNLQIYFLLFLLFSGCKRVTVEANDNPQGYADSQVVGIWKITEILSDKAYDWDGNGTKEKDVFATYSDCEKNMLYQFIQDKTGIYQLNCNTTKNGTWLILNTLYLVWTAEGSAQRNEKISNMTSNQFYTSRTMQIVLGETITITSKWQRQ